jgi:tellurite resistance protein
MQAAVAIASNYLQADPERIAYELGRAAAFGWVDPQLKEQFTAGLRDGLKGGGS